MEGPTYNIHQKTCDLLVCVICKLNINNKLSSRRLRLSRSPLASMYQIVLIMQNETVKGEMMLHVIFCVDFITTRNFPRRWIAIMPQQRKILWCRSSAPSCVFPPDHNIRSFFFAIGFIADIGLHAIDTHIKHFLKTGNEGDTCWTRY